MVASFAGLAKDGVDRYDGREILPDEGLTVVEDNTVRGGQRRSARSIRSLFAVRHIEERSVYRLTSHAAIDFVTAPAQSG